MISNVFLLLIYYIIGLDEDDTSLSIQLLSTLFLGQRLFETRFDSMEAKLKDMFDLVLNIGNVVDKKSQLFTCSLFFPEFESCFCCLKPTQYDFVHGVGQIVE